mmetsp:Transcript_44755/g.83543  ORF Transcript_44755/g.83543 Transcript_44755/m.83543 type:complete len:203 (-) Transcript_44755:919-1527(-)
MQHICRVSKVVERIRQVLLFTRLYEFLYSQQFIFSGDESFQRLMEARDREYCKVAPLCFRCSERVETPGLIDLLRHAQVLKLDDGRQVLLAAHGHGAPVLLDLFFNHVLALHHVQNPNVLLLHLRSGLLRFSRLQISDDCKLLHNLFQQLHLAGAINIIGLLFLLLIILEFRRELEDSRCNRLHCGQHALQRTHSEVCDDAR